MFVCRDCDAGNFSGDLNTDSLSGMVGGLQEIMICMGNTTSLAALLSLALSPVSPLSSSASCPLAHRRTSSDASPYLSDDELFPSQINYVR